MENYVSYKNLILSTNDNGDGLFLWACAANQPSPQWCQLKGNCQFSVDGLKDKEGKIKKYAKKHLFDEEGNVCLPHEWRLKQDFYAAIQRDFDGNIEKIVLAKDCLEAKDKALELLKALPRDLIQKKVVCSASVTKKTNKNFSNEEIKEMFLEANENNNWKLGWIPKEMEFYLLRKAAHLKGLGK